MLAISKQKCQAPKPPAKARGLEIQIDLVSGSTTTESAARWAARLGVVVPTGGTIFERASFINFDGTSVQFFTIPHGDGGCCFLFGRHFHKAEAFGLTGEFVFNNDCRNDCSCLSERRTQSVIGSLIGQAADIELFVHFWTKNL